MSFNIWMNHLLCNLWQFVIIVGSHTRIWASRGQEPFPTFNCSIPPSSISAWYTLGSFLWMTEWIYVNCAWWKCLFRTPRWFTLSHQPWQPFQGWASIKSWHTNFPVMKGYCILYKACKFQRHVLSGAFMHFLCIWLPMSNYLSS